MSIYSFCCVVILVRLSSNAVENLSRSSLVGRPGSVVDFAISEFQSPSTLSMPMRLLLVPKLSDKRMKSKSIIERDVVGQPCARYSKKRSWSCSSRRIASIACNERALFGHKRKHNGNSCPHTCATTSVASTITEGAHSSATS